MRDCVQRIAVQWTQTEGEREMGSGYFPVGRDTELGKALLQAVSDVEGAMHRWREHHDEGDSGQFDNAASDGAYIDKIYMGASFIEEAVEPTEEQKRNRAEAPALRRELERKEKRIADLEVELAQYRQAAKAIGSISKAGAG